MGLKKQLVSSPEQVQGFSPEKIYKTVIIVGVLLDKSSTNVSMAKAFMKLGFKILPINYRSIIQKHGHQLFENLLIETVKKHTPVLTIFCKCNGVNPEIVKECTKFSTTWLWNPDPYQTIEQCPEVIEHMKNCKFCSSTGGGTHERFVRKYGLTNSYHIFCGLDYDLYKPVESVPEYEADISFIGNSTPERDYFKKVLEAKYKTKFYGSGYIKSVYEEEFSKVCSSSTFMLSLNTYNDIPDYFSNRLLRYMNSGTCVLHYDPTNTLYKYFKHGEEILFFRSTEELLDLINNTTLAKAGKIALYGREKVLRNYTWEHTIQNMLNIAV